MEKKIWTAPKAEVENFMANEYVAACWKIYCNVPSGTGYYETNGQPGYQEGGYFTQGDEYIASGYGCDEWHGGVPGVSGDGPQPNAMWQERKTGKYYEVFHFSTGRGNNDQHFSKVEDAQWETNPNAS